MKKYSWILFDADDTLFQFDSYTGLCLVFSQWGVEFTKEDYRRYQVINQSLWTEYQNGTINAQELQVRRFENWAEKLQCPAESLNKAFMMFMADICKPMDGASSLLKALHKKAQVGIITNGFIDLQETRLKRTGFKHFIDVLIISEEIGYAKPHPRIFEYALAEMGHPARETVLMVGDNPDSDILGGINAGIDTCWLNVDNKPTPQHITPDYQVENLQQLEQLLLDSFRLSA